MSSDWSDTMVDIAVTFFYHPIYMIIGQSLCRRKSSLEETEVQNHQQKQTDNLFSQNISAPSNFTI